MVALSCKLKTLNTIACSVWRIRCTQLGFVVVGWTLGLAASAISFLSQVRLGAQGVCAEMRATGAKP